MFIHGETPSAHSARPKKLPGWMVLVREYFSVNKCDQIALRGFCLFAFSNFNFTISFHGFHLKKLKIIFTTFTDTEVNNSFSIYHTSEITSGPKTNFIYGNIPTEASLFFFVYSEVNSTWLITSKLANQRARKVLFTCVCGIY